MSQFPMMLVEWDDASSRREGSWHRMDALQDQQEPLHCRSVGFLVHENKKLLVLAASISGEQNGNVHLFGSGDIVILKTSITKRKRLR